MKLSITWSSVLYLLVAFLNVARGSIDYQLVIYATNAPSGALDKIGKNNTFFANMFLPLLPGYRLLSPGAYERRARQLRGSEEGEEFPSLQEEESDHRDLQSSSQCPASCKTKSTATCRSMGCYTCSRRRRLLFVELLSCTDALLEESLVNLQLAPYCGLNLFCSIKAKMMKVNQNGTAVPVC